jgi:hypothetical protein
MDAFGSVYSRIPPAIGFNRIRRRETLRSLTRRPPDGGPTFAGRTDGGSPTCLGHPRRGLHRKSSPANCYVAALSRSPSTSSRAAPRASEASSAPTSTPRISYLTGATTAGPSHVHQSSSCRRAAHSPRRRFPDALTLLRRTHDQSVLSSRNVRPQQAGEPGESGGGHGSQVRSLIRSVRGSSSEIRCTE